jgi:hypothetical protein
VASGSRREVTPSSVELSDEESFSKAHRSLGSKRVNEVFKMESTLDGTVKIPVPSTAVANAL